MEIFDMDLKMRNGGFNVKKTIMLTVILLSLLLTACSNEEQNWNGTFYQDLNNGHILAFTLEQEGEDIRIGIKDIATDNGLSISSVYIYAELVNKNTAKDDNKNSFTLKGDTLTANCENVGEIGTEFRTNFSGTYIRGESVEERFELDDSGGELHGEIVLNGAYYLNGDYNDENLYFKDDEKLIIVIPGEGVFEFDYTIYENELIITIEGNDHILTILDSDTLEDENGNQYILLPDANEDSDE